MSEPLDDESSDGFTSDDASELELSSRDELDEPSSPEDVPELDELELELELDELDELELEVFPVNAMW